MDFAVTPRKVNILFAHLIKITAIFLIKHVAPIQERIMCSSFLAFTQMNINTISFSFLERIHKTLWIPRHSAVVQITFSFTFSISLITLFCVLLCREKNSSFIIPLLARTEKAPFSSFIVSFNWIAKHRTILS